MRKLIAKILKIEHRKAKRFKTLEAVLILFDPKDLQGIEILDLSLEGVAFSYVAEGKQLQLSDTFDLDIQTEDGFQLGKVKVEVVSDTVLAEVVGKEKVVRRIGGKFANLTQVQEYDLKKFLDTYGNK